jgi:aldehyde:ferredoxin oxidoreductase
MNGYHGKFLKVDLDHLTCEDMPLQTQVLQHYIGGATLAAALIYDDVQAGMKPLAPQSPLVFATGPLTATSIPMVSRYAVAGISPLTGFWGEATSGGRFPFRLKGAGYDGIFITGRAPTPVILHVEKGVARLEPVGDVWGLDTYASQEKIKERSPGLDVSIACIGPAGENLIPFAAVMNDRGRAAGRCGMGALMGSKNLKAVVVAGGQRAEVADKQQLAALSKEALATVNGSLMSVALKEYGTLFYMDMAMALGDVPAKYFTESVFPAEKISGQALRQRYLMNNYACQGCPIGCGREVVNFSSQFDRVDGPEYETTGVFGPLCQNYDLDSIVEANHLCNAYGLDTISSGVSIAYAMYLYEKGVLDQDRAGMTLQWGDGRAIVQLIHHIVTGQGLGALLAKGTLAMAHALGRDPEEAAQVKGLELPMHDGRAFHGQAVSYATGPRGACHLKGDYFNVDLGGKIKELCIFPGDRFNSQGKGAAAAKLQSIKDLYDALTICKFSPLSITSLCRIYTSITGLPMDPETLLTAGDRSVNLKRAINIKLGLTRDQDQLPRIAAVALHDGATAEKAPDMETLLTEYYHHRGWDPVTGRPLKETLLSLGLAQTLRDLYPEDESLR